MESGSGSGSGSGGLLMGSGSGFLMGSGSAESGDFTDPLTVTFPPGSGNGTTMTVTISAVDDAIAEGDEEFQVSVGSTSPAVTDGSPTSLTVTILDDDRKLSCCDTSLDLVLVKQTFCLRKLITYL